MKQGHEDTMMGSHPGGRVTASSVRCSIFEYLMVRFIFPLGTVSPGGFTVGRRPYSRMGRNSISQRLLVQGTRKYSGTMDRLSGSINRVISVIHPNTIAYPEDLFLNSLRVVSLSHQQWSGFDCTMIQRQKRRIAKGILPQT
ncbi:hypothetical protein Bca101_097485 [Brassica carinata]